MDDELVQLASIYASPGNLLLATQDGERAGCIGLREIQSVSIAAGTSDVRVGEIRRLFVRPEVRAAGTGRNLTEQVVRDARDSGFGRLVLNTLPQMTAARSLYESLGFKPCDPYVDEPLEDTLYLGLELS